MLGVSISPMLTSYHWTRLMVCATPTCKTPSMHGISNMRSMGYARLLPTYTYNCLAIGKLLICEALHPPQSQYAGHLSPDALEVRWQAYRVTTAIVHLGPDRQQGHYRAAAFLPGQSRLWYSDDNQAAVEMSHIPAQVSEQCYVLGCMLR